MLIIHWNELPVHPVTGTICRFGRQKPSLRIGTEVVSPISFKVGDLLHFGQSLLLHSKSSRLVLISEQLVHAKRFPFTLGTDLLSQSIERVVSLKLSYLES